MNIIYLDCAATTPCNSKAYEAMLNFNKYFYGNAASQHILGRYSASAIDKSRQYIAKCLNAKMSEIIFTSGSTESNNIAIQGAFNLNDKSPTNGIFSSIDHKSIIETANELQNRGLNSRFLELNKFGKINLNSLRAHIDSDTKLISICHVNSETGVIQEIDNISKLIGSHQLIFHVDATQSFGKIDIDVERNRIDCLSISAHKIGGPKGIGILYVRESIQNKLHPIMYGGGQHRLRSGTAPTDLIVGFGEAARILLEKNKKEDWNKTSYLRKIFIKTISETGVKFKINIPDEICVPHIINLRFTNVKSEALIHSLGNICIASGSACNSKNLKPSYVLTGIGLSNEEANSSVRISFNSEINERDLIRSAFLIGKKALQLQYY